MLLEIYLPNPTKFGRSKFVGVFGIGDRIHPGVLTIALRAIVITPG